MRTSVLFFVSLWLAACGSVPPATVSGTGWASYGAPIADGPSLAAKDLLADPSLHVGKSVVVEGRVADVCAKAGCWMVIAEGDRTMRVRMKDHDFAVAKDGAGSDCRVAGDVVAVKIDPDTVAHYEGESRKPEIMPEKTAKAGVIYEIVATGVAFRPAG